MEKRIAIPTVDGKLCSHFGHCESFYFADIKNNQIVGEIMITPPDHEPGLYPKWVKAQGASLVIGGGMGNKAQQLFAANKVEYIVGAPTIAPREVIEHYLKGELKTSGNQCNH